MQHARGDRFGLVRRMVADQQVQDTLGLAGRDQDRVSGDARPLGQRRSRRKTSQPQHTRGNAAPGQDPLGRRRLVGRCSAQAVIHHQADDCTAARPRPVVRQHRERQTVGPPGHGNSQKRRRLERPKSRHCRGKFAIGHQRPAIQ